jgi:hypothetical protein
MVILEVRGPWCFSQTSASVLAEPERPPASNEIVRAISFNAGQISLYAGQISFNAGTHN